MMFFVQTVGKGIQHSKDKVFTLIAYSNKIFDDISFYVCLYTKQILDAFG